MSATNGRKDSRSLLRKWRLFLAVLAAGLVLGLHRPDLGAAAAANAADFLLEVLKIVPPVMVLMGLLDAWVPRKLVEDNLGPASGVRGIGLSLLLGTAAAGPLYAAFPIGVALRDKGARLANLVIFLGTWATIKVPMIMMEMNFLGVRFALLRLALTVPGVIAVGLAMERMLAPDARGRAVVPAGPAE